MITNKIAYHQVPPDKRAAALPTLDLLDEVHTLLGGLLLLSPIEARTLLPEVEKLALTAVLGRQPLPINPLCALRDIVRRIVAEIDAADALDQHTTGPLPQLEEVL